jgi:phosphoglucomutase
VEVVDSVADYVKLMKEIFDFDSLRDLLKGTEGREPFKILINSLNGGKLNMHLSRRLC